jgi:hypothetical protein
VLWKGLDAPCHHQQQPGRTRVIPLANQLPDQQVAVQQVQGDEQRGGGGCAALLQLQAHPEQLVPGHLCGSGTEKGRQLYRRLLLFSRYSHVDGFDEPNSVGVLADAGLCVANKQSDAAQHREPL